MKKYKGTLVILGHSNRLFDANTIKNWKSNLFEITTIQTIENLPESEVKDFYFDQKYEKDQLSGLIKCPKESDFAVAIMAYRFVDNFYMHRLGKNCVAIS
ncbi:MAG: hypothetical protein WBM07_13020, partial [Chitinivibrionales bacterium]